MDMELFEYPPTLEDYLEIRQQMSSLPYRELQTLSSDKRFIQWTATHAKLILQLKRVEATINLARRARRDAMLLAAAQPMLKEIQSCM